MSAGFATSSEIRIRPMTPPDVAATVAVLDAGEWPRRTSFFRHVLGVPACHVFVAELDGRVIGTGIGTVCGTVGWVGSIFVDHRLRRRGYGRVITEAVCDDLQAAGCETLALIASEYGRPVYERMGFRIDRWHRILQARDDTAETSADAERRSRSRATTGGDITLRGATLGDLPAIRALDRLAAGSDRGALLESVIDRASVAERDAALLGFTCSIVPAWPAIVAVDDRAALRLLDHVHTGGQRPHATIVGTDPARERLLVEAGWECVFETPQMLRGPGIDWRPQLIWGLLGLGFG